jgi:hypothetical protein
VLGILIVFGNTRLVIGWFSGGGFLRETEGVFLLFLIAPYVAVGIFGFWVGLKRRAPGLWRHSLLIGALVGIAASLGMLSAALSAPGMPPLWDDLFYLFSFAVFPFTPALILYVSSSLIGHALQRRAIRARAGEMPRGLDQGAAEWSPKTQALIGFAGTVLGSLIGLIGSIITAGMASGG